MITLYRFDYSCYALKVQMLLDLLALPYETVEVPYGNRSELATLTGDYVQVPVLQMEDGQVIVDSRRICEALLRKYPNEAVLPAALQGPVWGYADWCDSQLEDVMFRLASPGIRERFSGYWERALFTFIKERKYGQGCVDQWRLQQDLLIEQARMLLAYTRQTLHHQPYLFGDRPTLADAALYGQFAMLKAADAQLPDRIEPVFADWMHRLECAVR